MSSEAKMKRNIAVLVVLAFCAVGFAQEAPIHNFLRVNEEFCTAGQPTLDQLSKLKAEGIRTVLNLRPASEYDATDEEAKAKELGLKYFNVPITAGAIKDEQVVEFLKLTDDTEKRPMFIHCASANRVGALWMIRRVLRDGWKSVDSENEAAKIGLTSAVLKDFALRYIETHRKN